MSQTREIAHKAELFWQKNKGVSSQDEMDKVATRLYNSLKMEHAAYHEKFPLMLIALSRGVYDEHNAYVYFKDIADKGSLGNDDDQIERAARYMAFTSAALHSRMGKAVKLSTVRKNKKGIIDRLKKDRETMKEAYKALKKSSDTTGAERETEANKAAEEEARELSELQDYLIGLSVL